MNKDWIKTLQSFKFISFTPGPATNMKVMTRMDVKPEKSQLLMKIKAIGLNRPDILLRKGQYPVKSPAETFLGLEAAGEVYDPISGQKLFDGFALVDGRAYAEYMIVPEKNVMKKPQNLSFVEAAGIPETWLTSYQLLKLAGIKANDKVMVYAAAGGVGTSAIQICKYLKAVPYGLTSFNKLSLVQKLGAKAFDYKRQKWQEEALKVTGGKGFDIILDSLGGSVMKNTLKIIGYDSKWVLFGTMGGGKVDINLNEFFPKRPQIIFSTLKARSQDYKAELIKDFTEEILPAFKTGEVKPIIGNVIQHSWDSGNADAFIQGHNIIEDNKTEGKVIIKIK